MEAIVYSGTKLRIDYYIEEVMDEDRMEDIYSYFKEESETDDLDEALDVLGDDYTEEEIRLVRVKFLSEMANQEKLALPYVAIQRFFCIFAANKILLALWHHLLQTKL